MSNVSGVNVLNYEDYKSRDLIVVAKIGGNHILTIKRFNPETGEELVPQVSVMDMKQLNKTRAGLVKQLVGLDKLIADLTEA